VTSQGGLPRGLRPLDSRKEVCPEGSALWTSARSHGLLDLGMRPNHAKFSHGLAAGSLFYPGPALRAGPGFPGQGTMFLARGCEGKDSPCSCLLLNKAPPGAKPVGGGPLGRPVPRANARGTGRIQVQGMVSPGKGLQGEGFPLPWRGF
jgi:hypothetical protein